MDVDSEESGQRQNIFVVDPKYEFSAPHFFDFSKVESEDEAAAAERWFQAALSYAQSPCVLKLKSVRELSMGCSLEEYIEVQKLVARVSSEVPKERAASCAYKTLTADKASEDKFVPPGLMCSKSKDEPCTPSVQISQHFLEIKSSKPVDSTSHVSVKHNHSDWEKPAFKFPTTTKNREILIPSSKRTLAKRCLVASQKTDLGEEQAKKKQKLEGGQSCQVWNGKSNLPPSRNLPTLTVPQEFHFNTDRRAQLHKDAGHCSSGIQDEGSRSPFISLAEMVQKFQLNISGHFGNQSQNHDKFPFSSKRTLRLTRPKEPMLGTSLRARPSRVKGFVEQETELLASLPKFKARPLNKRILEGPTLPALPRSIPQMPEFQEFNLRTMERALAHHEASTSLELIDLRESNRNFVPAHGEPHLRTAARARPPKIKSTEEMEQEQLAMVPQFKARPLNKRIFTSRGDVGIFPVPKRQATKPQEFHFATQDRALSSAFSEQKYKIGRTMNVQDQMRESSLHPSVAETFHLTTEIPPNPRSQQEPVKPDPFQLGSLLRHEKEQQRMIRPVTAEKELAEIRAFQGNPIHCTGPVVAPDRSRKPLSRIQQFVFQADAQSLERELFDRKNGDRWKRYDCQKQQQEVERKTEEDRAIMDLRRKTDIHPGPVPKFDAQFIPFRSTKELTQPISSYSTPIEHINLHKLSFPLFHMR